MGHGWDSRHDRICLPVYVPSLLQTTTHATPSPTDQRLIPMAFTIALASREDLPALAEVNRSAYSQELPSRFAHKNWTDVNSMFHFFKARLAARFDHVGTQVFKAFEPDSGKIAGFACWTHETAAASNNEVDRRTPTGTMIQKMPPTVNVEFMKTVGAEIEQLREHMKGEEHYCRFNTTSSDLGFTEQGVINHVALTTYLDLSAFAVDLGQQNKGIGSQLLKHCLQIADDAALPSWLISFPGSHDLYLRFGFCDVDHRDVDLNAWDKNKMRGYGVYRQYAMVRRLK
ncbi:hypothetical protein FHL15_009217 [Xylaria flabelliformis]|uniref:N-acetyltransferase domain-containing protein n=1 Tax=Xylaria flabelliformis TaxID=2512241 RepID=A0A553HPR0_9PEZI|nr:hypothetical protein FHL15_009217 [Xylaria flabelliformis]